MYSDFTGDVDKRKSTTGCVSKLGETPITCASRQQNCVALSTTETEYIQLLQIPLEKSSGSECSQENSALK